MKINKLITIDIELVEKLKGYNKGSHSALINQLLYDYFNAQEPKTPEQMDREIKELEAKYRYEQELEKIKNEFHT